MSRRSRPPSLLKIAFLAVLLYFLFTRVRPWLEEHGSFHRSPKPEEWVASDRAEDTARRCLSAAGKVNDRLSRGIGRFSRTSSALQAWDSLVPTMREGIVEARMACGCPQAACEKAAQAILEIRNLLERWDSVRQGVEENWSNPANHQERINRLLAEARAAAK